jgi:hypothetical protein
VSLYPLCDWFAAIKRPRIDWWWSYLFIVVMECPLWVISYRGAVKS